MSRPATIALAVAAGLAALAAAAALASLAARSPAGDPPGGAAAELTAGTSEGPAHHLGLARQLLDDEDYPAAAAALDRALEADPENIEALALQARTLRLMRQYTAARDVARRLQKIAPGSALPHVLQASTLLQEGDAGSARLELERAVAIDPASPLALGQLAALDEMEGRTDAARAHAADALALDPGNVAALRVLAGQTRSVPELIRIHEQLLDANPGDLLARAWMGALRGCGCAEAGRIDAPQSEVAVPLQADPDGRLTVTARLTIGSRAEVLRLLVDTGGSGLVLSETLARRIGLPLEEFVESAGVGGATRHSHPLIVEEMRFPDAPALRVRCLMATASNFGTGHDGIINPLILVPPGAGRILELHLSRPEMAILPARRAEQPAGRAWVTVPFLSDGLHPIYSLMVAERPARALLDTGAGADLIDRSLMRWLPPAGLPAHERAGNTLVGFAGQVEGAERASGVPIRMAGENFLSHSAWVVDLNADNFRFRVDMGAVVGIESLRRFDIRVDRASGRLSFRTMP